MMSNGIIQITIMGREFKVLIRMIKKAYPKSGSLITYQWHDGIGYFDLNPIKGSPMYWDVVDFINAFI